MSHIRSEQQTIEQAGLGQIIEPEGKLVLVIGHDRCQLSPNEMHEIDIMLLGGRIDARDELSAPGAIPPEEQTRL